MAFLGKRTIFLLVNSAACLFLFCHFAYLRPYISAETPEFHMEENTFSKIKGKGNEHLYIYLLTEQKENERIAGFAEWQPCQPKKYVENAVIISIKEGQVCASTFGFNVRDQELPGKGQQKQKLCEPRAQSSNNGREHSALLNLLVLSASEPSAGIQPSWLARVIANFTSLIFGTKMTLKWHFEGVLFNHFVLSDSAGKADGCRSILWPWDLQNGMCCAHAITPKLWLYQDACGEHRSRFNTRNQYKSIFCLILEKLCQWNHL